MRTPSTFKFGLSGSELFQPTAFSTFGETTNTAFLYAFVQFAQWQNKLLKKRTGKGVASEWATACNLTIYI